MAKSARSQTNARGGAAAPKRYVHQEQAVARPEIGAAPRFKAKAAPMTYRYDSSLSPTLDWDTNPARETAAFLLDCIEQAARLGEPHEFPEPRELKGADGAALLRIGGLQDALAALKRMQAPFLNWAGKAERAGFEVPTLPLFVHERLSTAAIIKTLEDHRKRPDQGDMLELFADPQMPLSKQVDAYQHKNRWVNRLILGDSLVVMNSLLRFEGLGGQVQMIYIDPPYGVRFGSNFQPFVRKNTVSASDDADMTREPEMVQAYRDTWQLGVHSYLTYLRDRLLVARDLLTPSGSVFVQISDENLQHVRELLDEVFGGENFCSQISFVKNSGQTSRLLSGNADYILWYARDIERVRYRQIYLGKLLGENLAERYDQLELEDGSTRPISDDEQSGHVALPSGSRAFALQPAISAGYRPGTTVDYVLDGRVYHPGPTRNWKYTIPGMDRLAAAGRLVGLGKMIEPVTNLV